MKKAILNEARCDQSPFCPVKRVCPAGAVTQKVKMFRGSYPIIDADACTGCGICIRYCPMGAVEIIEKVQEAGA